MSMTTRAAVSEVRGGGAHVARRRGEADGDGGRGIGTNLGDGRRRSRDRREVERVGVEPDDTRSASVTVITPAGGAISSVMRVPGADRLDAGR